MLRNSPRSFGRNKNSNIISPAQSISQKTLIGWPGNSLASSQGILLPVSIPASLDSNTSSISFNGSQNQALSVRLNEIFIYLSKFSIICKSYFTTFGAGGATNYGGIFGSWDSNSVASGQLIYYNGSGTNVTRPQFGVASGNSFYSIAAPENAWKINTWQLNICEVDKSLGKLRLFIDGSKIGEIDMPINLAINAGSDTFAFGGYALANNAILTNIQGNLKHILILSDITTEVEKNYLNNLI